MKLLPQTFEKKGFLHAEEYREGNIAIYKRWKPEGTPHWETIIVRVAPASKFTVDEPKNGHIRTRTIEREEQEVYPSSEQWGKFGWTYGSYEAARAKAESIVEGSR